MDTGLRRYDGQRVVIDAQIIAAREFSKEARRTRTFQMTKAPNFVVFVSFVVKISSH